MDTENHFDAIVECCSYLDICKQDDAIDKKEVIASMEMRMHVLLRRAVCTSIFPYMSMSTWKIITDVSTDT
jgi:hypothetical protein